jgi:hypothetical protein
MRMNPSFSPERKYLVKCCGDIWERIGLIVERRKGILNEENFGKHENNNFKKIILIFFIFSNRDRVLQWNSSDVHYFVALNSNHTILNYPLSFVSGTWSSFRPIVP